MLTCRISTIGRGLLLPPELFKNPRGLAGVVLLSKVCCWVKWLLPAIQLGLICQGLCGATRCGSRAIGVLFHTRVSPAIVSQGRTPYDGSQNTKSICCSVCTVSDPFFPESVRLSHRHRTTSPNVHFSLGEVSLWLSASLSASGPRSEPLCSLLPNSFSCASVVTEVRFSQSDDCWAPAAIHPTPALGIYCL